ncbi:MAG TPA: response regulator, partial [Blastocatellia bacterium]
MAKKGSILVVDDEEVMRDVLDSLLTSEGYEVELARNGEEGLDKFQQRAFDLVLLDVSMPGIGGLRTLEELLKLDPEVVIAMITAYATFDTAIAAMQRGAFTVIPKPFDNREILRLVAGGLRRRRKDEERRTLKQALKHSTEQREI